MKYVLAICAGVLLCGCTSSMGRLTLASNQPVVPAIDPGMRVDGAHCADNVFGIPVTAPASIVTATERALARAPGATMLADTTVWNDYMVTIVYNRSCWRVVGNA